MRLLKVYFSDPLPVLPIHEDDISQNTMALEGPDSDTQKKKKITDVFERNVPFYDLAQGHIGNSLSFHHPHHQRAEKVKFRAENVFLHSIFCLEP